MENIENIKPNIDNTEPPINDESLEDVANRRSAQIAQKKLLFGKVRFLFFILLLTGSGLVFTWYYYSREQALQPTKPIIKETDPDKNPDQQVSAQWEMYRDDNLKIFAKVPPLAKAFSYKEPSLKLEIVYSTTAPDFSLVNESNLKNGYIFRITPLSLGIRDLNKVTEIKRESFKLRCPPTATVTPAQGTKVDTVDATTFDVYNCGVDYKLSYVPRFGIFYEIAQIYSGDIWYRQQFKNTTEELLSTFRFFPEDSPKPYEPFITFLSDANNLLFKYPVELDTKCCDMSGPSVKYPNLLQKLLVIALPSTHKTNLEFDGIGVFVDSTMSYLNTDLNSYLDQEKQILTEDYKVVTGKLPESSESEVKVGTTTGRMLSGYKWEGDDLIFVQIPNDATKRILVLEIRNKTGDESKKAIDAILASFEFFAKTN